MAVTKSALPHACWWRILIQSVGWGPLLFRAKFGDPSRLYRGRRCFANNRSHGRIDGMHVAAVIHVLKEVVSRDAAGNSTGPSHSRPFPLENSPLSRSRAREQTGPDVARETPLEKTRKYRLAGIGFCQTNKPLSEMNSG